MWAKPKQRSAIVKSIPAPTKGLNDYNSIANMEPTYALDMLNMYPSAKSLKVRNGYREWVTGFGKQVKTIMSYNKFNGANELYAATDDGVFNSTTPGPAPAPITALTLGRLSHVNFSNVAGQYLVAVNGQDAGKLYNGTTWVNFTTVATPTNPGEVKGASISSMSQVHAYKKRMWFIQKNSMTAWYLPTDAVGGQLTPFYLGGIFLQGGFLQNIFTWSMDAGDGLDDILVFQSSKGEVAGYSGPDPDTAATFALQSVYFVGPPLGDRTSDDLGGDVAMLTSEGIIPIRKVVGGTQAISRDADSLSRNISKTFNQLLTSRVYNPQWEILNIPSLQSLIVNFPSTGGEAALQFVMNTLTGAWTKYDLPIFTMGEHNNALYFADTQGRLLFLDINSNLDNVGLAGDAGVFIVSGAQCAYNYFELVGTNKVFSMVRPLFTSQVKPSVLINLAVDFQPNPIYAIPPPAGGPTSAEFWDAATWGFTAWFLPNVPTAADVWDSGIWDATLWSAPVETQYDWIGTSGMGYSASLTIKMSTNVATEFVSCDWVITPSMSL